MASKAKKGTPAPTSKGRRGLAKGKTHDGRMNRAQRSAVNKTVHALDLAAAREAQEEVVTTVKTAGKQAANALGLRTTQAVKITGGRPWEYPRVEWSDELGTALFTLISTGHSMREIAEIEGMPPLPQMLVWLGEPTHPFTICRARAKELLVPLYEEMAQHLTMNSNIGEIVTERQVVTKDGDIVDTVETRRVDNVERSKLALQGLQWTLGHLMPRKHGRNAEPASNGPNEQLKGLFDALKAGPVD